MIADVMTIDATTIGIDFRANALTVSSDVPIVAIPLADGASGEAVAATIDIGTRGRLLGIELEAQDGTPLLAVAIADPTPADTAVMRSARIPVTVSHQPASSSDRGTLAILFSRHGDDYDISWPSGNQCWRRTSVGPDGTPLVTCAVITST